MSERQNLLPLEVIASRIYIVRNQKVMLDRDLAQLYGVETRVLNQAVRRNIKRFPEDFMFQLTRDEIMNLSHFVITPGFKHSPNVFAFTEQGVAMLSGILNSERAIEVNISIMRAFVKIREYLSTHKEVVMKLEEHDHQIKNIFAILNKLLMPPQDEPKKRIGFV